MTSKPKSKQEEALQFLDDLDSLSTGAITTNTEGEAEVLAFIDEITQKSTEPTRPHSDRPLSRAATPTLRKSTDRVKLPGGGGLSPSASSSTSSLSKSVTDQSGGGGWGWGSVWSTASAAIQQAKTVVDEQVKALPKNEQARKWGEGVMEYAKAAQLDKIGQDFKRVGLSTLTDILNVVAPPISEHEVIQVWLSHEMQCYDGVESLVYRALSRVMEQVEGGDLIVNRGDESRPKPDAAVERNFNAVEGYDAAYKLAQADTTELIKTNAQVLLHSPQSQTTYSHVYLRVQPYLTTRSRSPERLTVEEQQHLQFLLYLSDPANQLTHVTITQVVPERWLALWDEYDWVEDLVAEILRVGVEVIGQEYLVARMGWVGNASIGIQQEIPSDESIENGNIGGKV